MYQLHPVFYRKSPLIFMIEVYQSRVLKMFQKKKKTS